MAGCRDPDDVTRVPAPLLSPILSCFLPTDDLMSSSVPLVPSPQFQLQLGEDASWVATGMAFRRLGM